MRENASDDTAFSSGAGLQLRHKRTMAPPRRPVKLSFGARPADRAQDPARLCLPHGLGALKLKTELLLPGAFCLR